MTTMHKLLLLKPGWRCSLWLYVVIMVMGIVPGLGVGQARADNLFEHVSEACRPRADALSPLALTVLDRVTPLAVVDNSTVPADLMFTACNRVDAVLADGPQIFPRLRDEIAKAQYEVDITSFHWTAESEAVKYVGEGLKQAANMPGRRDKLLVRILIDDLTWPTTDKPAAALYKAVKQWDLDPNKVRIQLATYPHKVRAALHDKYTVIDSKVVLVTGANFSSLNNAPNPQHDTGYVLSGNVALSALASFDHAWNGKARHWTCKKRAFRRDCQRTSYSQPKRGWLASIQRESGDVQMLTLTRDSNSIHSRATDNPQDQAWLAAMDNAKKDISILTPNINDDAFQDAVVRAAARGVKVRLITGLGFGDSSESGAFSGGTNLDVVGSLRQRMFSDFPNQRAKLEMCWFSRGGIVPGFGEGSNGTHAKVMMVDGQIAIVGSGNHDTQSWNYSREFNVLIDNSKAVGAMEKSFFSRDWDNAICELVEFYEANNGGKELICSKGALQDQAGHITESGCKNDAARSAVLHKVPAGRVFRLYDSPSGSRDDDWTEILVKRYVPEKIVASFERSFEDADIRMTYHRNNGLDGKVSWFESSSVPDLRPTVELYEGNAGTQNLVCSLDVSAKLQLNFKKRPLCANDEVRSMMLYNIPAGRTFRLFDSSSGSLKDDWLEVQVKRDLGAKLIAGLEQSFEDADVRVIYHSDNGLEGKVSRLEVR